MGGLNRGQSSILDRPDKKEVGKHMESTWPWEDVEGSRSNRRLQRKHSVEHGKKEYLAMASVCPGCQTPPDELSWFYSKARRKRGKCSAAAPDGWGFATNATGRPLSSRKCQANRDRGIGNNSGESKKRSHQIQNRSASAAKTSV